jgi:hypothetical protein
MSDMCNNNKVFKCGAGRKKKMKKEEDEEDKKSYYTR